MTRRVDGMQVTRTGSHPSSRLLAPMATSSTASPHPLHMELPLVRPSTALRAPPAWRGQPAQRYAAAAANRPRDPRQALIAGVGRPNARGTARDPRPVAPIRPPSAPRTKTLRFMAALPGHSDSGPHARRAPSAGQSRRQTTRRSACEANMTLVLDEAAVATAVLLALVLAAALLSYFVVAPECEKRLVRQLQRERRLRRRVVRSLVDWDIEAGSSNDDSPFFFKMDAVETRVTTPPTAGRQGAARTPPLHHAQSAVALTRSSRGASRRSDARLTRRRKSESDALKEANRARAEMLRRRVALRKLELEIERSRVANEDLSTSGLEEVPELLKRLMNHPPECERELAALAAFKPGTELSADVVEAVRTMHDVLALHLSAAFRDVNKVTIFCNALLRHDGLNRLRALETEAGDDVRALANAIIEMAVPAIWT